MFVVNITAVIISCIGIPLNGIVIWLLGFQIKRNPFTILILNLAIADFGNLVFFVICSICSLIEFESKEFLLFIIDSFIDILYMTSLFLLTAISIDRCVCVLFPIWHRCSRPKYLSPAVCTFLWILSVLLVGIQNSLRYNFGFGTWQYIYTFVPSVLCLPLITISTLILFVKICPKPKQIKRRRMLVMILITLLCFLSLTLPLYICAFINFSYFIHLTEFPELYGYLILGACLNSTVNPIIYYLVGRKKRAQTRESIKVIFQRVFREDEASESPENATKRVSNPL